MQFKVESTIKEQKTTRPESGLFSIPMPIYLHLAFGRFFANSSSMTFFASKRFTVFFEWDFTGFPTPVRLFAI
ncbi:MAG: hypothetical protein PHX30_00550 [Candidatus Pacebacteria bacterium]|nr:hypothetical protein [Candidatus Paceibacterota bacterium]